MSQVDRGWSKGRRGGWNPNRCIDPSSRPPSSMLIRSVNVDHGRLIRIGTANALFIDRDIDGDRDAKIKPKSVLSCLKRILDDFTSTIGTATSHLSSFYRSVPLSIINDNIHTSHSSINFFLHVTFEILPCSFFRWHVTNSIHSRQKWEGGGKEETFRYLEMLEKGKGGSVRSSSDLSVSISSFGFSLFKLTLLDACKMFF